MNMKNVTALCPICAGSGVIGPACIDTVLGGFWRKSAECSTCGGEGVISDLIARWIERGGKMRVERIRAKVSLRQRAAELGVTPRVLNDMEHGRQDPFSLFESRAP